MPVPGLSNISFAMSNFISGNFVVVGNRKGAAVFCPDPGTENKVHWPSECSPQTEVAELECRQRQLLLTKGRSDGGLHREEAHVFQQFPRSWNGSRDCD